MQNLLLGASAMGLGGFWSTSPALAHPLTLRWCGFDLERQGFIGCIWLGHPTEQPEAPPRRPVTDITTWL